MDNPERVKRLILKLRSITVAVQLLPFALSALYIVDLVLYLFVDDNLLDIIDSMLYVSPAVIAGFLVFSRILELCRWHRVCCIIPILPQINILIDRYVYELSEVAVTAHIVLLIVMMTLFLTSAYNVFFKH